MGSWRKATNIGVGHVTTFAPPANVILVLAQTADEKGGKPGRTRSHDDRSQTSTSIHTRTRLCQRWRRGLSVCRVPARSAAALKLALSSLNWVPPRLWLRSATTPLPGPLLPLPFARPCGHLGSPPRCMSAPGPRVAQGAGAARGAVSVRGLRRALPSIEVGNSFTSRWVAAAHTEQLPQLHQDPQQWCCRVEGALSGSLDEDKSRRACRRRT